MRKGARRNRHVVVANSLHAWCSGSRQALTITSIADRQLQDTKRSSNSSSMQLAQVTRADQRPEVSSHCSPLVRAPSLERRSAVAVVEDSLVPRSTCPVVSVSREQMLCRGKHGEFCVAKGCGQLAVVGIGRACVPRADAATVIRFSTSALAGVVRRRTG